jgi:hypothetical protein
MKILVACEFTGTVRDALIAKGHDAVSCDLLPSEKPGPHYTGNIFDIINDDWNMMIAFPPCTHLAVSGARHFKKKQEDGRQQEGIDFFLQIVNSKINKIAIENPVGIMSTIYRKPDQIIQPWMFGDSFQKTTCIWLKNLPKLVPTNIVDKGEFVTFKSGKRMSKWYNTKQTGHERSKTFQGIANAMAKQWG